MRELINLTGQPVAVYAQRPIDAGVSAGAPLRVIAADPLKPPARLRETPLGPHRAIDAGAVEVPVVDVQYGPAVIDLPPPALGTAYIVCLPVALAARRRHDLLVPGDLVHAADGTVLGCRALTRPL